MGSNARQCFSGGKQHLRGWRPDGQRLGVDIHSVCPIPRFRALSVLPWVFSRFLRWEAFCHEGRVGPYGGLHAPPLVPELVSIALPIRLCRISVCTALTAERAKNVDSIDSR